MLAGTSVSGEQRQAPHRRLAGSDQHRVMCDSSSVEYLRDLVAEKDFLDTQEDHKLLKYLLDQGM